MGRKTKSLASPPRLGRDDSLRIARHPWARRMIPPIGHKWSNGDDLFGHSGTVGRIGPQAEGF